MLDIVREEKKRQSERDRTAFDRGEVYLDC